MEHKLFFTEKFWIPEDSISVSYIRSSGPGGQNVNKVSTAAQLRFDLINTPLPEELIERAKVIAGSRLTSKGEIVVTASSYRTQELNYADGVSRILDILKKAAHKPKARIPTRPTLGSKKRRIETKNKRSETKKLRKSVQLD